MAKVSDKRLADWFEQVADGLDAGLDAENAVLLAKPLAEVGGSLSAALREGRGWAAVFSEPKLALDESELAILAASEKAGQLPSALRKVADWRRKALAIRRRLRLSLAYPLFLVHFAAFVFSVTHLVDAGVGAFLVSAGMVLVPVWLVVFFFWLLNRSWPEATLFLLRRLPILKSYRLNWESAILCDVLASCFSAGMGVEDSWEAAVLASGSPKHLKLYMRIAESVGNGGKASAAMQGSGHGLPAGFAELYRSGESSGKLDANLESAAKRFRTEASNRLTLAMLLYPKLILFAIFGYVGYKIVSYVSEYFDRLSEITM